MKKLLLILSSIFLFTSCEDKSNFTKKLKTYPCPRYGKVTINLEEINIDSCQYLYGDWGNATVLTHKGNCNNKLHYR